MSEVFFPHGGGAELSTYLYARLLAKAGYRIVVLTNRFPGEPEFSESEGFAIYRSSLFKSNRSMKYSMLLRPDVLLTGFVHRWIKWADLIYIPRFWFSAVPLAKVYKKPVVVHLHDYIVICPLANLFSSVKKHICDRQGSCSSHCIYTYERRRRNVTKAVQSTLVNLTVWPILRKLIELSDAIVCVSDAQKSLVIRKKPELAYKIRVIYNPLPEIEQFGIEEDGFGYFGGDSPSKGFIVLLEAIRQLGDFSPNLHVTNFGNPQGTNELFKGGVEVYGRLKPHEIAVLYHKIRGVIVPSVVPETFSYVVAEALLRGRLVVASRIGAIPELVHTCKGVWLFEPGDSSQLAEKMKLISGLTTEEAYKLGLSNREAFVKFVDNSRVLRSFLDLCNSLIAARS